MLTLFYDRVNSGHLFWVNLDFFSRNMIKCIQIDLRQKYFILLLIWAQFWRIFTMFALSREQLFKGTNGDIKHEDTMEDYKTCIDL